MKKIIMGVVAIFITATIFAQESKPVIGLTDLVVSQRRTLATGNWGEIWREAVKDSKTGKIITPRKMIAPAANPVDVSTIIPSLKAAFSQEIVNSGRFTVIDKNSGENVDGIDFLFHAELTEFSANRDNNGYASYKMIISVKFTNVKTGQIILSQQFEQPAPEKTKLGFLSFDAVHSVSDPMALPPKMASSVVNTIVLKLYPPTVLNVTGDVIQISATGLEVGSVVEAFEQGEEIIDPYTGDFLGYNETLVAEIVVYEINGRIANAKPDPKGKFVDAQVQKGMAIRATTKKNNKAAKALKKAK